MWGPNPGPSTQWGPCWPLPLLSLTCSVTTWATLPLGTAGKILRLKTHTELYLPEVSTVSHIP